MRRASDYPRRVRILLLTLVVALAAAPAAAAKRKPVFKVTVDARQTDHRIPRSFLGVSQEYRLIERMTGNARTGVNPVSTGLFAELSRFGGGSPVVRVGGGSTDDAWWNPQRRPPPPGVYLDLRESLVNGLRDFLATTGSKAILGVNLAANDPALMTEWAWVARSVIPRANLAAFEIGNEPDYYPRRTYKDANGNVVPTRGPGWGPAAYREELGRFLDAMKAAVPDVPLAGPAVAPEQAWLSSLPALLRRHGDSLGLVTLHRYPLSACPGSPRPTTATLLGRPAFASASASIAASVRQARRAGLRVRLGETNSAFCGGTPGVSNSFAAALWSIDWMFLMAALGVDGVNFHASSPNSWPFGFYIAPGGRQAGGAAPLFYGMLAFAEATANRGRLIRSAYYAKRPRKRSAQIYSWGIWDGKERKVRVLITNKERFLGGTAVVRIPRARGRATLKRLTAPSAAAQSGIRWGGQAVAAPTFDGRLEGTPRVRRVSGGRRDRFRIKLPAVSAALLTVKVRR